MDYFSDKDVLRKTFFDKDVRHVSTSLSYFRFDALTKWTKNKLQELARHSLET